MSFQLADELHQVAGEAVFTRTTVQSREIEGFSVAVDSLRRAVSPDDANDTYWRPILRRLRHARWILATVPLPASHPSLKLAAIRSEIASSAAYCAELFPSYSETLDSAIEALDQVIEVDVDPLGQRISELLMSRRPPLPQIALVLLGSRFIGDAEKRFEMAGDLTILDAAALTFLEPRPEAWFVGSPSWFPESALLAPKAYANRFLQFAWLRDRSFSRMLFEASPAETLLFRHTGDGDSRLASATLLPETDWSAIRASRQGQNSGEDPVPACLVILASDQAMYLETDKGSRIHIAEMAGEITLRQEPASEVQSGTYLVIREGGDGDYIREIADGLLATRRHDLRTRQDQWKSSLRSLVAEIGLDATVRRLKRSGSLVANEANVRRWSSPRSIRTQDYVDFEAIMTVIGLVSESQSLWMAMGEIDSAHRRAGHLVRELLEKEILSSDWQLLLERGWMDYDVQEIDGEGSLRVARVEAVAPEHFEVARSDTRQPFPIDGELWHA